jgi:hypothetical protein
MSSQQQVKWRAFSLPKRGNRIEEYEDAYAGNPEAGRFAVADGASESSFSGLWAQLLVEGFVRPTPREEDEKSWLEPLRKRWAAEVDPRSLAWYAEEKRQQGAFATFLGLVLKRSDKGPGGRWKAMAVGDSCMFQVGKDGLIGSFPLSNPDDFGNAPNLVCSRNSSTEPPLRSRVEWGKWRPGERIFLMTDALAQWFLARSRTDRKPWVALAQPRPEAALTEYIEKLRDNDGLRNDDVTLLTIDL